MNVTSHHEVRIRSAQIEQYVVLQVHVTWDLHDDRDSVLLCILFDQLRCVVLYILYHWPAMTVRD